MPRKPRFYQPDIPAHVVQRGNCKQAVFFDNADYRMYRHWLFEGASKYGCQIHAYVLMTNHVHILLTPNTKDSISQTIQHVGRNYVSHINRTYGKSGTLWEGRHKGCVIDSEAYLLACMRYVELNPVRAGMVEHPKDYRWSSYHDNAMEVDNKHVSPHSSYLALASNNEERGHRYRMLFKQSLDSDKMQDIRATVQTGTPLGNSRFRDQVSKTLGCKVGQAKRGRPRL